jgi:hypothetical protein
MAKKIRERIIPSSGNVFSDMGLPDAGELYAEVRRLYARAERGSLSKLQAVLDKVKDAPPEDADRL